METKILKDNMDEAARIIAAGGLVAVPTETVYGIAGNGLDENAVEAIYELKGRPQIKPLALMVPNACAMEKYCEDVPRQAKLLAEKFWPGPLSIVLKSKDIVPDIVRAGGETVSLRCPKHPLTLKALELSELPFAAPSANPSGSPSPKNAETVMEYFEGKIPAVIDGGECTLGVESTIIDMSRTPYKILRQGALPEKEIAAVLSEKLNIIGITGGTGCGKTSLLGELKKLGALIIDCDELYHRMLDSNTEMLADIENAFPGLTENGALDRKALGKIVFNDEKKLAILNEITHRHIGMELDRILADYAMNGGRVAAIDAIALIESGIAKRCSTLIAVTADREKRIERIMQRDGIDRAYAELRVDAQKNASYYEDKCDYVITNNSTEENFRIECKKLLKEVL